VNTIGRNKIQGSIRNLQKDENISGQLT